MAADKTAFVGVVAALEVSRPERDSQGPADAPPARESVAPRAREGVAQGAAGKVSRTERDTSAPDSPARQGKPAVPGDRESVAPRAGHSPDSTEEYEERTEGERRGVGPHPPFSESPDGEGRADLRSRATNSAEDGHAIAGRCETCGAPLTTTARGRLVACPCRGRAGAGDPPAGMRRAAQGGV